MKGELLSWEEAVLWLKKQPDKKDIVRFCYYDDPLSESAERFYHSTEWQAVQTVLSDIQCGKALDIGAGRGISSYALAQDRWQVTALEPNPSSIVGSDAIKQLSRDENLTITVIEEHGETLPFGDNSFDLVYGRAVLHHVKNLEKFCQEMVRVLRPGGLLIVTREHVLSRKKDLQAFLKTHPLHSLYGGENALLLDEYIDALFTTGLDLKKVIAPYDSDINLFPQTQSLYKEKLSRKAGISIPDCLFKGVLVPLLNKIDTTPGRLYSFIGTKR